MKNPSLMGPAWASGMICGVCLLAAALAPGESQAGMNKDQRRQIMGRSVFVLSLVDNGKGLEPYARGSGSILTPDGAVLTNRHVVWNDDKNRPADALAIGLTTNFAQQPELKCLANPAHGIIHEDVDLALIKCETDMQGKPWQPNNWPVEQIGSSEDLTPGDDIIVIGYPAVGGWTINYTMGKVSGFMGKDDHDGRFWLKTDAEIGSGNSGGSALDENGNLIGVPTAVNSGKESANGRVGLVRPIELGRDLIDLARGGWQPGGGGNNNGNNGNNSGFGGRSNPPPQKQIVDGITVIGQVRSVEDSKPIRDATVIILKPGIKVAQLDKDHLADQVLTAARSDSSGHFTTVGAVPRGGHFAVVVIADGFDALVQDDVLTTDANSPDPFDPWGTITLKRQ